MAKPSVLIALALFLGACKTQPAPEPDPLARAEALVREGKVEEAIPLLDAASDTSESALMSLALLYQARDTAQALQALERGVAKGWRNAAYLSAALRIAGPDSAAGVARLRHLAARGHPQAMHELGSLYVQGRRGVPANADSGLAWMVQADRAATEAARRTMAQERHRWPEPLQARYRRVADSLAGR